VLRPLLERGLSHVEAVQEVTATVGRGFRKLLGSECALERREIDPETSRIPDQLESLAIQRDQLLADCATQAMQGLSKRIARLCLRHVTPQQVDDFVAAHFAASREIREQRQRLAIPQAGRSNAGVALEAGDSEQMQAKRDEVSLPDRVWRVPLGQSRRTQLRYSKDESRNGPVTSQMLESDAAEQLVKRRAIVWPQTPCWQRLTDDVRISAESNERRRSSNVPLT
jgi:hypothetical protein